MNDPIPAIAADAKADVLKAEALIAPAATDFKALIATRAGDLLIAVIALGGVVIGHLL